MGNQGFFLRVVFATYLASELRAGHTFVLLVPQPVPLILILLPLANGTYVTRLIATLILIRLPYAHFLFHIFLNLFHSPLYLPSSFISIAIVIVLLLSFNDFP